MYDLIEAAGATPFVVELLAEDWGPATKATADAFEADLRAHYGTPRNTRGADV